MKYLLLIVSFVFITNIADAQSRAPKKIREAFAEKYPTAEKLNWVSKGERLKEWTAHYQIGNDSLQTAFDHKANWLFTYTFIDIAALPEAVTYTIFDEYMKAEIIVAARMEEPGFDGFGVAFMYLNDRWGVQITKEGKIIRRRLTSKGF